MVTSTCTLPAVMLVVLTSHFLRGLLLVLLSGPFGRAYQRLHPNASGVCQPHTCANHTRTAGPQDCNGDDQCIWNSSAATPCEPFACSNLQTAQACGNFSRRDCSWDEAHVRGSLGASLASWDEAGKRGAASPLTAAWRVQNPDFLRYRLVTGGAAREAGTTTHRRISGATLSLI